MLKTIIVLTLVAIFTMGTVAAMAECNSCGTPCNTCAKPCATCSSPDNFLQQIYDWFAGWHNPWGSSCNPCNTCGK